MPIKPFSFPIPETRFFHTTTHVYKFKIQCGAHFNKEDTGNKEYILKEIVESIRAVLANHDNLHPFSTEHFIIFPYKTKWDSVSRLRFKHRSKNLLPFPYVFTIYIEPKSLLYDENEIQLPDYPEKEIQEPCPSSALDAPKAGILQFFASLNPLRFLFGGRNSD
ncbi:membrane-anchored junction protein [Rhinophrynus dorsalis]